MRAVAQLDAVEREAVVRKGHGRPHIHLLRVRVRVRVRVRARVRVGVRVRVVHEYVGRLGLGLG